jgi:ribosomal subunit interface protein
MTTNIKATGLTLTDEVRAYIEKCLTKIKKYVPDEAAVAIQVEVERTMSHEAGEGYRGELTLSGGGLSVRAESEGASLHEAIDILETKIVGELRKVKGKRQHILRRQAKRVKDFIRGWRS